MAGRFVTEGVARVRALVGRGILRGRVVVDQPYAQDQHESVWYRHPRGGQAKYLETPLLAQATGYTQHLAEHVLSGGLVNAMQDNVEDLAGNQLSRHAPVDTGKLRESGHPIVEDGGQTVFDRPPVQARERG
jgi:hypothetical protein